MLASTLARSNVVLTGTHRVKNHHHQQGGMKIEKDSRRTVCTATTATSSSMDEEDVTKSSGMWSSEDSELFLRVLSEEMMKVAKEESDNDGSGHKGKFESLARSLARDCLRRVEESSTSSFFEEAAASSNAPTTATATEVSDYTGLSTGERRRTSKTDDASLDLFHPDFWLVQEADEGDEARSRAVTETSEGNGTAASPHSAGDLAGKQGPTIREFLKQLDDDASTSSEGDNDDECSVLSEMTGLTGVFEDFPSDHLKKAEPAPSVTSVSDEAAETSSLTSSASNKTKKKDRSNLTVSFSKVQVRQYERILCDNPGVSTGPSIGVGWQYNAEEARDVDDWEMERRRLRRPADLMLNRAQREQLLLGWGYSATEIATAVRGVNKARSRRRQTINNLGAAPVELLVESAKKKMQKMLFLHKRR